MESQYQLGFLPDAVIFEHVKETVMKYRRSINLAEFNHNIVDPIKLTFDSKVYDKSLSEILDAECLRQIDKSNNNTIGYFHQFLFKHVGQGWDVPVAGFDVENNERHIFVELKNKHNTMNSASSQRTYLKMQNKILQDDQAQCFLVEVIAKKSQNIKWVVSLNGQQFAHDRIRRMSIDRFYEMVFGQPDAFMRLCKALPQILDDVLAENSTAKLQNSVMQELGQENFFRNLFLLAFETYEGFEQF